MISLIDLVFIYTLYVLAIGIVYKFEITIFESLKKSITLPITPFKHLISALKPLTPLQKEIRDEERTIKQLEAQKADMERLEDLKRKREALFEEMGEADLKCRVYTPEQTERILNEKCSKEKYRLRYNGIEINKLFATEEEAFTYAEAASDNNYFEAEVRRIN